MKRSLASIHVYPIKSLGGFSVDEAELTDRGLKHDRRWMLVDPEGVFLTQREHAAMACLQITPGETGFRVTDNRSGATLDLPWAIGTGNERPCRVWGDHLHSVVGNDAWNAWFSRQLDAPVELVFMPNHSERPTDETYAKGLTSLSDGFPYSILSQATVDDLNARGLSLAQEHAGAWVDIPTDRFRPNLVIAGGNAFQEDEWKRISIGSVPFSLVKPSARCTIITTDQQSGARDREPLRTLATYRSSGNKVLFGMNAVGAPSGIVRVGDLVHV